MSRERLEPIMTNVAVVRALADHLSIGVTAN